MSARYTGGLVYNAPGGWSGYFDGAGDYLSVASNAANALGSGDFTIQFWFNLSGTTGIGSSGEIGFIGCGIVTASRYTVRLQGTSTRLLSWWLNTPSNNVVGTTPISLNTWYHIAWVRSGSGSNNVKLYLNGILESQGTSTYNSPADTILIGRTYTNLDAEYTNGYLSNMQIVVGTALYTGNFTPPVGPLQAVTNTSLLTCAYPTFRDGSTNNFTITVNGNTAVSTVNPFPTSQLPNPALGNAGNGVYTMSQYAALKAANLWPAFDPYYKNVTLNLHGNGTNAAQNNTFLDSSTNNLTITRYGNTTQGTFTPYGSNWSNYFDGNGDDLRISTNAAFAIGTGDFTFEAWINPPSWATAAPFFVCTGTGGLWIGKNGSNFVVRAYGVADQLQYATMPTTNAWTHIVAVRSGTTLSLFYNGTRVATTTNSYSFAQQPVAIGSDGEPSAPTYYTGYISNLRLVKGTAVYNPTSSTLTVPTAPLTAITNTSLLTCADNRFIDDSTNNFTITRNGDVSVQRFSPFSPTSAYSASVIGGSGYFDGTGDYLSVASQTALGMGSGDFTYEAWIYVNEIVPTNALRGLYDSRVSGSTGCGIYTSADSGATSKLVYATNSAIAATSTNTIKPYCWTYVAVTRSSGTVRGFLNGVLEFTVTDSRTFSSSAPTYIGTDVSPQYFNGFINDARILKGTAQYTSAFTPPTAPLTAITNTSLLLNYTNAGILDNAMMNDLETVGNAQISTSVKKYGTGSMYFDGSGDYLVPSAPSSNVNLGLGSGDFTVEFWVYFIGGLGSDIVLFDGRPLSTNGAYPTIYVNSLSQVSYVVSSSDRITSASAFSTSTWYHIAVARSGTSTKMFVNGTQVGSTYTDSTNYLSASRRPVIAINGFNETAAPLNGYIDDLRITKGVARYTANFTPPTSQVQDQ